MDKLLTKFIEELLKQNIPILSLEEHNVIGGLGSAIAEVIAESQKKVIFKRIGINDKFSHYVGNHNFQRDMMGLLQKPSLTFIHKK